MIPMEKALSEQDDLIALAALEVPKEEGEIVVNCAIPTYLPGWTREETRTLKQLIKTRPIGDWDQYLRFLPVKRIAQIKNKITRLLGIRSLKAVMSKTHPSKWPAIAETEVEVPTFDRDLRMTPEYQRLTMEADRFLARYETGLVGAIEDRLKSSGESL